MRAILQAPNRIIVPTNKTYNLNFKVSQSRLLISINYSSVMWENRLILYWYLYEKFNKYLPIPEKGNIYYNCNSKHDH